MCIVVSNRLVATPLYTGQSAQVYSPAVWSIEPMLGGGQWVVSVSTQLGSKPSSQSSTESCVVLSTVQVSPEQSSCSNLSTWALFCSLTSFKI